MIEAFPQNRDIYVKKAVQYNGNYLLNYPEYCSRPDYILLALQNGLPLAKVQEQFRRNMEMIQAAASGILAGKTAWPILRAKNSLVFGREIASEESNSFYLHLKSYLRERVEVMDAHDRKGSPFIRDFSVMRLDGVSSIPIRVHRLFDEENEEIFRSEFSILKLLPPRLSHFVQNWGAKYETFFGVGGDLDAFCSAVVAHHEAGHPIHFQRGLVEGGNVFLFLKNGVPHAIVGELSLYISLWHMEKLGFFHGLQYDPSIIPTEDAFQIAKNALFVPYKSTKEEKIVEMATPVPEPLKEILYSSAVVEQQKLNIVRRLIAEDLGVQEEHLLFLPQRQYHLDLEMNVTPEGEVILHDEGCAKRLLENIHEQQSSSSYHQRFFTFKFLESSTQKQSLDLIKDLQVERLLQKGFSVHLLPLVLHAPTLQSELNYANGVFMKRHEDSEQEAIQREDKPYFFFTTGPTLQEDSAIHELAIQTLKTVLPQCEVVSLPGLSHFIGRRGGGIRCLTTERFAPRRQ